MRVLHLIDAKSDWAGLHAVRVLVEQSAGEHRVVLAGNARLAEQSERLGLNSRDRIPSRGPASGLQALMRHRPTPDVVLAWSLSTALIAAKAFAGTPVIGMLTRRPAALSRIKARAMRWCFGRMAAIVTTSEAQRYAWERLIDGMVEQVVVALPIDRQLLARVDRGSVRDTWGISEQTTVLGALGEPGSSVDSRLISYQAGVMSIAGRSTAAITPSSGRDLERALRFMGRHEKRWRIVIEDRPAWEWLTACDVAVWSEDRGHLHGPAAPCKRTPPGVEGLAWAAAAGVPIIADDTPLARETIGAEGATFVPPGVTLELNRGLMRVLDDHTRREACVRAAREAVAGRTPDAFARAIAGVCERLAGVTA